MAWIGGGDDRCNFVTGNRDFDESDHSGGNCLFYHGMKRKIVVVGFVPL